ncbi:unnamed protein product, partial [Ectocarpus sp. 12 AP-2014]
SAEEPTANTGGGEDPTGSRLYSVTSLRRRRSCGATTSHAAGRVLIASGAPDDSQVVEQNQSKVQMKQRWGDIRCIIPFCLRLFDLTLQLITNPTNLIREWGISPRPSSCGLG